MSAGSGNSRTTMYAPLTSQLVSSPGSGRSRTTMVLRLGLLSTPSSAGSGSSRMSFYAPLELLAIPIPPGPERWDGPTYSFTGDGGR